MRNKTRFLIKNLSLLSISNFSSKILVFFLVPLYTSVLSTEEYGYYDLIFTSIQLLFPVLTLNISDAVLRFLMDKKADDEYVLNYAYILIFISNVIVCVFITLNHYFEWNYFVKEFGMLIFLYYLSYSLNQLFIQIAKGFERVFDLGLASFLGTIALVVFNLILLLVLKLGLRGFFYANIISYLLPVTYYIIRFKTLKSFHIVEVNHILREMLYYCIPLILTTLGWWINNSSDKYVVSVFCGVAANGLLSVAYKLPSIMNNINQIFIQAWQISAIKEKEMEEGSNFYNQIFKIVMVFAGMISMILIIFSKLIGKLLFQDDFFLAWIYTPFLLVSMFFCAMAGFLGAILIAKKDSKTMVLSSVVSAIVNVFLNILLVYFFSIQGVTIATAVSSFLIYFIRYRHLPELRGNTSIMLYLFAILLSLQATLVIACSNKWPLLFAPLAMVWICRSILKAGLEKVFIWLKQKHPTH